ncbi:hypothetical protein FHR92_002452 [Fontibacillus solani]|uniref:Uncharacterized protein n=1 Tax=Fontibacillus solani TaxID=1572857 RepID=A0A7W3STI3_9BACL|nr:hypothetical protein [Fontibacillus solani]
MEMNNINSGEAVIVLSAACCSKDLRREVGYPKDNIFLESRYKIAF